MLAVVRLVAQWAAIRAGLPADFGEMTLRLRVRDERQAARASALLAPMLAGRSGTEVRFTCSGQAGPQSEEILRRLLDRLDREGIWGELELASQTDRAAPAEPTPASHPLAQQWDEALARLPPDWSDVLAEVELTASDYLAPAALQLSPLNPARDGKRFALSFRCSRTFGYGAAEPMVRRCLERLDAAGIPGRVRILRALSDTQAVATQGPVWYVGGKVL
jgi:hypothetical protein